MTRSVSLRATLLGVAVGFGLLATTAMVVLVLRVGAAAKALELSEIASAHEDDIADRLVNAAYAQQIAALEYRSSPSSELAGRFESRGVQAFALVRQYLFLPLPLDARLGVERIKEAHGRFEVAARRAIDASAAGDVAAVRRLAPDVAARADEFGRAVRVFVEGRDDQNAAIREERSAELSGLQRVTLVVAGFVVLVAMLLGLLLRRIVVEPLKHFESAALAVAAGEAGARVPPQRYAEFSVVADRFNAMAEQVHRSRRLVEEKNQELIAAIDDLRRTQEDMVQREKVSAMGEMLAGLSHELNNPLAAVLSTAEYLQLELKGVPESATRRLVQDFIDPLLREARRARDLVRNTLKFSRSSSGEVSSVDLNQIVQLCVSLRTHAFTQAGMRLTTSVPDGVSVVGDAQKLQMVGMNLINNALDALQESGARGHEVRVLVEPDGDWVSLIVEDDGPGFADTSRAFEPFYTTKPVGKGTGLGLSLVHRFVNECGGTVSLANGGSGGARVTIRLRKADAGLRRDTTAPAALHDSHSAPVGADVDLQTAPSSAISGVVLVVEDEANVRRIQERFLSRLGVRTLLADGGAAAISILQARDVDLIITDLRMPGAVDGADLLRWLESNRPDLAATALVVTGDSQGAGLDSLRVPRERILTKPFDYADYERRVRLALARRRAAVPQTAPGDA